MGVLSFIVITAVNLNLNKNIVNYVDKEHEKETNDIKQELAQELEKIIYHVFIYVRRN